MAKNELTVDVEMRMVVPEKAVERCFILLEMWLADNPDKTIVIEKEGDTRVCLIAEEKQGKEETLSGP